MNPLHIFVLLFIGTLADLLSLPGRAWQAIRAWWLREGWLLAIIALATAVIMLLFGVGMSYGQQRVYITAFGSAPTANGAAYTEGVAMLAGLQFEDRFDWFAVQVSGAYDFSGDALFVSLRMGATVGKRDGFSANLYPFPYMNLTPNAGYAVPVGAELFWKDKVVVGAEYEIQKGKLYPAVRLRLPVVELDKKTRGAIAGHPAFY